MTPKEFYQALHEVFQDPDVIEELTHALSDHPDVIEALDRALDDAMHDPDVIRELNEAFDELLHDPKRTVPMSRRLQAIESPGNPWLTKAFSVPAVIVALITQVTSINTNPEATPVPDATPVPEAMPVLEAMPVPDATPVLEATPVPDAAPVLDATPAPAIDWDKIDPAELEGLNKRQKARADRKKLLGEIDQERARTKSAIDAVKAEQSNWKIELSDDDKRKLNERIAQANEEVRLAKKAVDDKQTAIDEADKVVKAAQKLVVERETAYTDTQKEFGQFVTMIKDGLKTIDKLRGEVVSAIDVKDWGRAYYKNSQLSAAIEQDLKLREPEKRQTELENKLGDYEDRVKDGVLIVGLITQAKKDQATKQQTLEQLNRELKPLKEELKRKQDGLETTISQFL